MVRGTLVKQRGMEGFIHELLDIMRVNPCSAKANVDFRSAQVFGLHLFERFHIDIEGFVRFRP